MKQLELGLIERNLTFEKLFREVRGAIEHPDPKDLLPVPKEVQRPRCWTHADNVATALTKKEEGGEQ